jgi:hypothetical protein
MITSLKSDIKNILYISTQADGTRLSHYVKGNIVVLDEFEVNREYPMRQVIQASNYEDGEEYQVVLCVYDD